MQSGRSIDSSLNAICPYFTMFPLSFPLSILQRFGRTGEWVIDPFCGRGTTNYASRALNMPSIGIDSSRVAVALTQAKLANTSSQRIIATAEHILSSGPAASNVPTGEFWRWAYHPKVLTALCKLREALIHDCRSDSRKALRALLLGALHGPRPKTKNSYFSNQSPRTYAPKPNYAVNYWRLHSLRPPYVDVLEIIRERAKRYFNDGGSSCIGKVIRADSRKSDTYNKLLTGEQIKWIITSPPYYGMRTYIADQWLRNWFVGGTDTVDYSTNHQLTHFSPNDFTSDLKLVWKNVASICSDDARLVIRFGGINDRKVDPISLLKTSLADSGWRIQTIRSAGEPSKGRRQAEHFTNVGEPVGEWDIWAKRDD